MGLPADNTSKMIALMRAMRRGMNGAVVECMEGHGLNYKASWGLSLRDIRIAAADLSPDHLFAHFLYTQQLREFRLAAIFIADHGVLSRQELGFWGAGVDNIEIAENLASFLLSRSKEAGYVIEDWMAQDSPALLKYCALLTGAKALDRGNAYVDKERLKEIAAHYSESPEDLLRQAAESLAIRLY